MTRNGRIDRIAVGLLALLSISGLVVFRIAMGWHVTDPYLRGTVAEAVPPTAWISVVPVFVVLGVIAALSLYRVTGVPLPGSRYR